MRHYMTSTSTALGDTVKTKVGATLTLPKNAKAIVGVWGHALGGPGSTTLEHVSGIMEFDAPGLNLAPMVLPLDNHTITGTGVAHVPIHVWPMNVSNVGTAEVTCYMTLDMAITLANTGRWGLIYED